MQNQYSDSSGEPAGRPIVTLALDTGSAVTSVALGRDGRLLGERRAEGGRSSARLLTLIDELLAAHDLSRRELDRVIAARGPGSFTGLRVGLATALGLHQALAIEATAVGTLRLLARATARPDDPRPVVALVDALRGEWFAQAFAAGGRGPELGEARIVAPDRLLDWTPCTVTGFGLDTLPAALLGADGLEIEEAAPLAPSLLAFADEGVDWDPAPLVEPLYLRPPAAKARRR